MASPPLVIPLLRAAAWFALDPLDPLLAPGADGFLDLAWGEPDVAFVDRLQRRRLSPLARGCFHCARRVDPPEQVRVVFASRHGEAERTLAILQDLAAGAEVSPALFSMSVHNAVPGLWSILTGDREPFSAVAAGPDSFGWGLVEALAAFRADPSGPVLYLYGDDRLPDPWASPTPRGVLHAVALLLGGPGRPLALGPGLPRPIPLLRTLRGTGISD
ncbi:MAG: beta-ketoacyl synthase chain length factor [Holophaga sp.]|nr:beta-ketoacyl synthase chain length factor [Holophaga sp.]